MDPYDDEACLYCPAVANSGCSCQLYGLPWSSSMSSVQAPLFPLDEHDKTVDLDEITHCMLFGNRFLDAPFEHKDFEIDDTLVWLGSGTLPPQAVVATGTDAKNNNLDYNTTTNWKFPDISFSPPPDSSSPIGYGIGPLSPDLDSSPLTDPVLPTPHLEDVTVGPLFDLLYRDYHPRVGGGVYRGTAITEFSIKNEISIPIPTTTTINRPPTPHPSSEFLAERIWFSDMGRSLQHLPELSKTHGDPMERLRGDSCSGSTDDLESHPTIDQGVVVECADSYTQDVCADSTQETGILESDRKSVTKCEQIGCHSSLTPVSFRDDSLISSNVSNSQHSTEPSSPPCFANHQGSQCATADVLNGNDDSPSKTPSCRVSNKSSSNLTQATLDKYMPVKRRRSTIEYSPLSKKLKLDRTVPRKPCNLSFKSNYKAKEPASLRRARSLRSEVSICSDTSKNSLFFSSSQRTPIPQAPLERKSSTISFPPTAPCTPLPDSADYERSKADPLSRTIAVYQHSSKADHDTKIPPVPIIAPPPYPAPTIVRCNEDQAIDRLKCLLLRERAERERDGLSVHDVERARTLKPETSLPRRDSASTSDSSDGASQWEEESSRSATESSASQDTTSLTANALVTQHRRITRKTWSDSLGIPADFRKDMVNWMLEILPKQQAPGHIVQLYDQLKNSPHTRFHAVHMFYRYFLRPKKAESWKLANERYQTIDVRSDWEEDGWDLAWASLALSHKLHRDVLPPLEPVYTCEFLDIKPLPWMRPAAVERAQRDIFRTLDFTLGSCTPQDILDELWNALPTLRKAVNQIRRGWEVAQRETWDKLFEAIAEPDMMQYPVTLLTAAALIDCLMLALALQFKTEAEGTGPSGCKCKSAPAPRVPERAPDGIEPTSWQIYTFEAMQTMEGVILDVKDVLQLSDMELDECRKWFSYIGQDSP